MVAVNARFLLADISKWIIFCVGADLMKQTTTVVCFLCVDMGYWQNKTRASVFVCSDSCQLLINCPLQFVVHCKGWVF